MHCDCEYQAPDAQRMHDVLPPGSTSDQCDLVPRTRVVQHAGAAPRIDRPADVLPPRDEIQVDVRPPARLGERRTAPARSRPGVRVRTQPRRFEMRCTCVSTQMFRWLLNARISTRLAVLRPTPGSDVSSSIVDGHASAEARRPAPRRSPSRTAPCSGRSSPGRSAARSPSPSASPSSAASARA